MTEKINLTMAAVDRLKPITGGRRWVYDDKTPGLSVLVTPTGAKAFYWLKKVNGQTERFRLGGFPDISVETARKLATNHNADASKGVNPADLKRKDRAELTLGNLWELFLEFHAPRKKASSVTEDRRLWKRYLESWQSRKLSAITNADVRKWHSRLGSDHGKYAANRALALLSMLFSVAKDHGEWKHPNPCEGVKKFAEKSRDRFLQPEELPAFLTALDNLPDQQVANVFRICLFTGARKGNVLSMRWEDIDLAGATWNIPDTKANDSQLVALVPEAVKLLTEIEKARTGSPFVFPSKEAGTLAGHVQNVQHHWKAVIEAAGLPALRVHDLRRTLGSWQALQGASLQIIGKGLGHKHNATTQRYARLTLEPVRQSMAQAVSAMLAAGKPTEGGVE